MRFIIFSLFLLGFTLPGFSQGKISGVITYYFNEYQGNKADIGASVILIDSSSVTNFDYNLYEKFHYGEFYQKMYFENMKLYESYSLALQKIGKGKKYDEDRKSLERGMQGTEKDMKRHKAEMERYEYDTPEKSAKIAVELNMHLLKLDEDFPKRTVDSNGNYSINIEPGVYYVYIKSGNRSGLTMPELDGKIYIKKVKISENSDKDISYNFDL